jgi:hypothetical protein
MDTTLKAISNDESAWLTSVTDEMWSLVDHDTWGSWSRVFGFIYETYQDLKDRHWGWLENGGILIVRSNEKFWVTLDVGKMYCYNDEGKAERQGYVFVRRPETIVDTRDFSVLNNSRTTGPMRP